MAEAVVVALEAVEVEEQKEPWLLEGRLGHHAIQVGDETAAVRETGQGVGHRFVPCQLEQPCVLPEGERQPDDDGRDGRRGE